MTTPTPPLDCLHHERAATHVIVYSSTGSIGAPLCDPCVSCSYTACCEPGTALELATEEPWCDQHSSPGAGADIVAIDSDRYRELVAQSAEGAR